MLPVVDCPFEMWSSLVTVKHVGLIGARTSDLRVRIGSRWALLRIFPVTFGVAVHRQPAVSALSSSFVPFSLSPSFSSSHQNAHGTLSPMSRTLLPHALIDLTLARASARLELLALQSLPRRSLSSGRRHAHQSALVEEIPGQNHTPYDLYEDRSLYSRC